MAVKCGAWKTWLEDLVAEILLQRLAASSFISENSLLRAWGGRVIHVFIIQIRYVSRGILAG